MSSVSRFSLAVERTNARSRVCRILTNGAIEIIRNRPVHPPLPSLIVRKKRKEKEILRIFIRIWSKGIRNLTSQLARNKEKKKTIFKSRMRKSKEHVDFVSRNQEDFFVEKFEKMYIICICKLLFISKLTRVHNCFKKNFREK